VLCQIELRPFGVFRPAREPMGRTAGIVTVPPGLNAKPGQSSVAGRQSSRTSNTGSGMSQSSQSDRIIAWILVVIQGTLIAAIVLIPRQHAWSEQVLITWLAWGAIAIAVLLGSWGAINLGSGLTPLPLPNGAVELVTRGPYRWIRHPIYSAVMLGMSGVAVRSRTPAVIAVAVVLSLFLAVKARWEEKHLRSTFPGYSDYERRVGRFIPGVGKVKTEY
jgi:protein-S-isoprenylcysteine O-methyltransferase Ste14